MRGATTLSAPGSRAIPGWLRQAAPWGLIALAALAGILPALLHGQPRTDSGEYDQVWTRQFAEALAHGQIYPRWLPHSFQGFGAPTFYFYPPLTFYLSSALYLAGAPLEASLTWAEGVLAFGAGAAMLAWLRHRQVRWPTFWACVYALAPYHLLDLHVRGDMAELGAFVWLPLIVLAIETGRWPLLALSYAALICTHLPMALLASLFLIAPISLAQWRTLRASALGCAFGLLISAIYLAPALTLQRFISTNLLWSDFYSPAHWSILHPSPQINILYLYAFTAAAVAAIAPAWMAEPRWRWIVIAVLTAVAGLGVAPIWSLPVIKNVQFPWRLFGIFEFAMITVLAEWRTRKWAPLAVLGGVLTLAPTAAMVIAVGLVTYTGRPDAAAIAINQDGLEYLPPNSGAEHDNDRHRLVYRSEIRAPSVETAIAEAARPTIAAGWTLSLASAAVTLLAARRRRRTASTPAD